MSSEGVTIACGKAALRFLGKSDISDAIGDLTGIGKKSIKSLVKSSLQALNEGPASEYSAVSAEDRQWVEAVLTRAYSRLVELHAREVIVESLVSTEALVQLAERAMTDGDIRDLEKSSEDVRGYMNGLSRAIATVVSKWYLANPDANRSAQSLVVGETLGAVRRMETQTERNHAHIVRKLDQFTNGLHVPEPEPELFTFEFDYKLESLTSEVELGELVTNAAVAVIERRAFSIEVTFPFLVTALESIDDKVSAAQLKRNYMSKSLRLERTLSAFFSPQVESVWGDFLEGNNRTIAARNILNLQARITPTGQMLKVWRDDPDINPITIGLAPDEVQSILNSVGLEHWNQLASGAYWKAADELPESTIVTKVMPGILDMLTLQGRIHGVDWPANLLHLHGWHISQG